MVYWMDNKWSTGEIVLAAGSSSDPNIYKSSPDDAENYPVPGTANVVTGTVTSNDSIVFRIGLKSPWPAYDADTNPARYAVVLLSYNNNTKHHKLYLRQGEGTDNLIPDGLRWSPYNLSSKNNEEIRTVLNSSNATFCEYPTQEKYIFKYNSTTAIPTHILLSAAQHNATPTGTGDPCHCIPGYTTLSPSPPPYNYANFGLPPAPWPLSYGYYADGWFDRGNIQTTKRASRTGIEAGYQGALLFHSENKSLFLTTNGTTPGPGNFAPGGSSVIKTSIETICVVAQWNAYGWSNNDPISAEAARISAGSVRCVKD